MWEDALCISDSDAEQKDMATMQMVMDERNFVHPDATEPCMQYDFMSCASVFPELCAALLF